jgi:phosphopantothenoylcysteine decarboxylase / phosphopantothenate---cysteine ligase
MMPFAGKTVLLGVCGSVAAYKACELASRLREQGANVLCVLTKSAQQLAHPAAFEAITGNRAITDMFMSAVNPEIEHIAVAQSADLFLIAPATANILAKAAHGIADDWLSTTLLATRAPIVYAPAMNTNMYLHPATQANIALLKERGAFFVGPASGMLACRTEGIGRLAAAQDILDAAQILSHKTKDYRGKRVLITSGPNHEPIDPMRYLGNRSSGKMGRLLALEALCRGAEVCVVSGPAAVQPPYGAEVVRIQTADEMFDAVMARSEGYDIIIGAAAVADYRAETLLGQKIKRHEDVFTLRLKPNRDIIASVAAVKKTGQMVVGFAAESDNVIQHGEEKLHKKNLDMLIANVIGGTQCAVGADRSDAYLLTLNTPPEKLPQVDKRELSGLIFDRLRAAF